MGIDDKDDPAFKPLIESGEGSAEGFEEAERLLQENAEAPSGNDPFDRISADVMEEDAESDLTTSEYGEADEIDSTEDDD